MRSILDRLYFLLVFSEVTGITVRVIRNGKEDASGRTSNPVLLLLNVVVILGALVYAYPHRARLWSRLLQLKWLFLVYLWMSITVFWSPLPETSLRAAVYLLVYLLVAAYFSVRYDTRALLSALNRCFFGAALLSFPGQFLLNSADDGVPGWRGVFTHKTSLGTSMILAVAVLLVSTKRWTATRCCALVLYMILLALSQSFTSVVATGFVFLFVFSQRIEGKIKATLYFTVAGMFSIFLLVTDPFSLLLSLGGKDSTFTGRAGVWAYSLVGIARQPLLGYGYQAFWGEASDVEHATHWVMDEAHNGPLQVMLDLGLVGFVLTLGVLANTWRRARRLQRMGSSDVALWTLTLFAAMFTHTPMEADLMLVHPIWFLIVVASFSCLRAEQERPPTHQHRTEAAKEAELLLV